MPDDENELNPSDEQPDEGGRDWKALRKQAEAGQQAAQERDAALRELAVLRSGVDVSSGIGKFFVENYKGENTPEAILEAAKEVGIPLVGETPAEPASPAEPSAEEGAARPSTDTPDNGTEQRQSLAAGATTDKPVAMHPSQKAEEIFRQAVKDGMAEDEAQGLFFRSKVASYQIDGDVRALSRVDTSLASRGQGPSGA